MPQLQDLRRISVVGTSCSGKSTLAGRLADILAIEHVELDAHFHMPGWQQRPVEEFRAIVERAAAGEAWVIDGNYGAVRDLVWARATMIVFLDLGFPLVMRRAISRTVQRWITGQPVCGENRETLRSMVGLEGIPIWVIRTHARNRRRYRLLLPEAAKRGIATVALRSVEEVDAFCEEIERAVERRGTSLSTTP